MQKQQHRQKNNKANKGNIRIIAGKHRGRKLPVVLAEGLRPTTDRVKETLFNWLMPYIQNSRCLDCFSGAGSLGFEAYSRGAKHTTLLELNKVAAQQLKQNKQLLSAETLDVINTDTLTFLQKPTTQYDIVFIDPPFRKTLVIDTINLLEQGWLANNAVVYLETEKELNNIAMPTHWQLLKEKTAGQVTYRLYKVSAS